MGPKFHQRFHTKQRTLYQMTLFYNITTTPPFREPRTLTPSLTASSQTRTHSLHLRFRFASRSPPVPNNTPPASTFLRSLSGRMADTRHCRLSFCPVKDKPGYCPPPVLVPASRTGLSARHALTPTYAHAATPGRLMEAAGPSRCWPGVELLLQGRPAEVCQR